MRAYKHSRIIVSCDGACVPNPGGWACWGWSAWLDGKEISYGSGQFGYGPDLTETWAGYAVVYKVLKRAQDKKQSVDIQCSSHVVVNQINGTLSIKGTRFLRLAPAVAQLLHDTKSTLAWVPREHNQRADALAQQAYREACKETT